MVPRRCDGELKTDQLMLSFYISPRPKVPTTITFNFIVPYIHTYTFIFWRFMHGFLFENQPRLGIYHQEGCVYGLWWPSRDQHLLPNNNIIVASKQPMPIYLYGHGLGTINIMDI
ncbi:hypothetical protein LINPERHAP2_LOCUS21209, partial [Linum perenne]